MPTIKSFKEDNNSYHDGQRSSLSRKSPGSVRMFASPRSNSNSKLTMKTPMLLKGMDLSVKKTVGG